MHWEKIYAILLSVFEEHITTKTTPAEVDLALVATLPLNDLTSSSYKAALLVETGAAAVQLGNSLYTIADKGKPECFQRLLDATDQSLLGASMMIAYGIDLKSGLADRWINDVTTTYEDCAEADSPPAPEIVISPVSAEDLFLD